MLGRIRTKLLVTSRRKLKTGASNDEDSTHTTNSLEGKDLALTPETKPDILPHERDDDLSIYPPSNLVSDSNAANSNVVEIRVATQSQERLWLATQELNTIIGEYVKDNSNLQMSEKMEKVRATIDKASKAGIYDLPTMLHTSLSELPKSMAGQSKGWATLVGGFLSKLYPLTTIVLGITAAGAEGATLMPLKGAANGVSLLLHLAMDERSRGDELIKQLERISFQSNRIAQINKLPDFIIGDVLLEKSTDLMTAILNFIRLSLMYFRHDYFYNLGRTLLLGPQLYADAKADLAVAIAEYDQALLLQLTTSVLSAKLPSNFTTVDQNTVSEEFLDWLQPSLFETEAQLHKSIELRVQGTLKWVIDSPEFRNWRIAINNDDHLLWFFGLPGIGKSVLSGYIVEILRAQYPDSPVLYFFLKGGETRIGTISEVVRTIAGQLTERDQDAQRHMIKLKSKGLKLGEGLSPSHLLKVLLHDYLKGAWKTVYIVIDGLDECSWSKETKSESDLASFIRSLALLNCRILISSRPTSVIVEELKRYPRKALEFDSTCDDIKFYIKTKVEANTVLKEGFEKLQIDPVEFLGSRSEGNFLWVSIVLDLLMKSRTRSLKSFEASINTLPPIVSQLYENVVVRIESNGNLQHATTILGWTLYSKSQLSVEDLRIVLEMDLEDEILDLEHLIEHEFGEFLVLVPHPESSQPPAQIGHETFRNYITKEAIPPYRIQESLENARITITCLKLMYNTHRGSSSILSYATNNWIEHFTNCDAQDQLSSELDDVLEEFLKGDGLQYWMVNASTKGGRSSALQFWRDVESLHDHVENWYRKRSTGDKKFLVNFPLGNTWAMHLSATLTTVWLNTLWDTYTIAEYIWRSAIKVWRDLSGQYDENMPLGMASSLSQLEEHLAIGQYNPKKKFHIFNAAVAYICSDFDGAEDLLWKAYDEDPENFRHLEGFGRLYRRKKHQNKEKCLEYWKKAIELDPHPMPSCGEDYWALLASVRLEKGDFEGACNAFWEALTYPAENNGEVFWHGLAILYEDAHEYGEAKLIYLKAIQKHPEDGWKYWPCAARCDKKLGDWKAELKTYIDAIEGDPDLQRHFLSDIENIAESRRGKQHYEETSDILSSILDHAEIEQPRFKQLFVKTYLEWGKWNEALVLLEELIPAAQPSELPHLWHKIGDAHLALGEFVKAISAYKQIPDDDITPDTVAWLGRAHALLGENVLAIREFKRAIRLSKADEFDGRVYTYSSLSKQRQAIIWLAETYEAGGRLKDAREQYLLAKEAYLDCRLAEEVLVENAGGHCIWRSEARTRRTLARVLEWLGELDAAREELVQAIRVFEITTYEEDDGFEKSEHEDAVKHLERISSHPELRPTNSTPEEILFELRRDMIFTRRSNLAVDGWGSKPPRFRV